MTGHRLGMPTGMTAVRQTELIKQRIRELPGKIREASPVQAVPVLAEVVPLRRQGLPELPVEPRICRLDEKGRIKLADASTELGWETTELSTGFDGLWVTLTPTGSAPRHRQVARHRNGRVTLPPAARRQLEVGPGGSVLLLMVPAARTVALVNPAALLLAAPLGLLSQADNPAPRNSPTHPNHQETPQ